MTVDKLIASLERLKAEGRITGDSDVNYGIDLAPIEGGIIGTSRDEPIVKILNLAPVSMDGVGPDGW